MDYLLYYPSLRIATSNLYLFVFCQYRYLPAPNAQLLQYKQNNFSYVQKIHKALPRNLSAPTVI